MLNKARDKSSWRGALLSTGATCAFMVAVRDVDAYLESMTKDGIFRD